MKSSKRFHLASPSILAGTALLLLIVIGGALPHLIENFSYEYAIFNLSGVNISLLVLLFGGIFYVIGNNPRWQSLASTAVILSGITLFIYIKFGKPTIGIDDANIFFVYAKHLAQEHGFVYNIGGERVEGFTSLLWVLIAAAAFYGSKRPECYLLAVNVVMVIAANVMVVNYLRRFPKKQGNAFYLIMYLALIAAIPEYILWTTISLMDTGVWSFLLVATAITVLDVERSSNSYFVITLSMLMLLLLLTRPEAMIYGLVFLGLAGMQLTGMAGRSRAFKLLVIPTLAYFVTLAGLTIFRIAYFGYPFPNTYYAKVSPSFTYNLQVGFKYFRSYVMAGILFGLIAVSVMVLAWKSLHHLRARRGDAPSSLNTLALASLCATGLALPIVHGGDHFNCFRFYQPFYPLFVLNLLVCWLAVEPQFFRHERRSSRMLRNVSALVALLLLINLTHKVTWGNVDIQEISIIYEFGVVERERALGTWYADAFSESAELPSIGVIVAGGFKFTYPGEVVDLMGLNNIKMGHSPGMRIGIKNHAAFNKAVFYELQPDIAFVNCSGEWGNDILKICGDPEYHRLYEQVYIRKNSQERAQLISVRRDWLPQLLQSRKLEVARWTP